MSCVSVEPSSKMPRAQANVVPLPNFRIQSSKDPSAQYYPLYIARLEVLRSRASQNSKDTWGPEISIKKLVELKIDDMDTCVVCGVLYKTQDYKPNVLHEFSEEFEVPAPLKVTKFIAESDQLVLEDEMRIRLIGNINISGLVSGMVIAVKGHQEESGKFEVEDICFPAFAPMDPKTMILEDDRYIVIASGLNLVNDRKTDGIQSLADWLTGWEHGLLRDVDMDKVIHVIFAGNTISSVPDNFNSVINNSAIDVGPDMDSMLAVVDSYFSDLSMCLHTTVMPGNYDPVNLSWPQQELHGSMFPKASTSEFFHCTTNPYAGTTNGCLIIGTSGKNIEDILLNSSLESPLEALETSLKSGLIAPTCPDTLACFPFTDSDPFVFTETPRIYFAGNQPSEGSKLLEWKQNGQTYKTLLVSVPEYSKTNRLALVNIRTLEVSFLRPEML